MFYLIQRLTWIVCNALENFFLRKRVYGRKNIENLDSGGVIFAANHSSKWDPFLIGSSIPAPYFKKMKGLRIMAFPKYTNKKWYRFYIRFVGAYPVYRNKGNYKESLAETIQMLKQGYSVIIFPTGKLSKDFDPSAARPGVAYLAKKVNAKIVPVCVADSHAISFWDFFLRRRRVSVSYGRPLVYDDIKGEDEDLKVLAKKIMDKVQSLSVNAEVRRESEAVKLKKAAKPA